MLSPQIQKLADRFDVISKDPKCSKIQIFRGSIPDPAGKAGEWLTAPPAKNFTSLSALLALFLWVSGPNHLQSWQLY